MISKRISSMVLAGLLCGLQVYGGKKKVVNNSDRGPCPVTHPFFKAGWASKGVALVSKDLAVEWMEPSSDEMTDGWVLNDGSIVHSFSKRKEEIAGIKLYGADKKLKWTYIVDKGRDNHSCQPLPGGGFLAGESTKGAAFMVEIDKNGKKLKEVALELPEALQKKADRDIHHLFRYVRKTKQGTYLAACMSYQKGVEWDGTGKVVREFPNCGFAAVRLPNGNTLVSGKAGVVEYDDSIQEVWSMKVKDFEKLNLWIQMLCGLQRLPNGNTIITNVSHGNLTKKGDLYKVFEVTRDKELVWWVDSPVFKGMNIGNIQVLDVKGDPAAFEVWR